MGNLLLEKARNRRVEALWANRISARLRTAVAESGTSSRPAARDDLARGQIRTKVFCARK